MEDYFINSEQKRKYIFGYYFFLGNNSMILQFLVRSWMRVFSGDSGDAEEFKKWTFSFFLSFRKNSRFQGHESFDTKTMF